MSLEMRDVDYSYLQITNPFWSLVHIADGGMSTEGFVLIVIVPAAAICMLLLNLRGVIRELRRVRTVLAGTRRSKTKRSCIRRR